jgi:HEAT repeat protein
MQDNLNCQERIPGLIEQLGNEDGSLRQTTRLSLIACGSQAVSALAQALEDQRSFVRWEAVKALVDITDLTVIPPLLKALEDDEYNIQQQAREGLLLKGRSAVGLLLQSLKEHPDSTRLQHGVQFILRSLDQQGQLNDLQRKVLDALEDGRPDSEVPAAIAAALESL